MLNGNKRCFKVNGLSPLERDLIYSYLQGAVYRRCNQDPNDWFAARDLVGEKNYYWQGTPLIRCNTFVGRIHYLEEEEHRYGLTYGFRPSDSEAMFQRVEELLAMGGAELKAEWKKQQKYKTLTGYVFHKLYHAEEGGNNG